MLKGQLSSYSELNKEMKLLLEQRASRIQHLEMVVHKQNDSVTESLNDMFTELFDSQVRDMLSLVIIFKLCCVD